MAQTYSKVIVPLGNGLALSLDNPDGHVTKKIQNALKGIYKGMSLAQAQAFTAKSEYADRVQVIEVQ